MANVYLPQYVGEAFVRVNGNSYEYVGTVVGTPSITGYDVQCNHITGFTYNTADSNGKNVYTAGERALALFEYGSGSATYPTACSTGYTVTPKVFYDNVFVAPSTGVIRVGDGGDYRINGISIPRGSSGGEPQWAPTTIFAGDVLSIAVGSYAVVYFSFLPNSHSDGNIAG